MEREFKLGHGSLGNGITVWNSAKEVNGDWVEAVKAINLNAAKQQTRRAGK